MNENASYAFEIERSGSWKWLPAGPLPLRGWFISKQVDRSILDFRVVVGNRFYPGRHGAIRPEILEQWPRFPRALYSGLEFTAVLAVGDRELRFEFLNENFQWVEFWRRKVSVNPLSLSGSVRPQLNLAYLPALFQRHMQKCVGATRFESPFTVDELIQQACTSADDWAPEPPLHAALDLPQPVAVARYEGIQVCGWAFHETLRIMRLYGTAGAGDFHPIKYGLPQAGVERHFGHFPYAKNTMLFGIFPLSPQQENPVQITVYVELEDGSHHLALRRRIWHTALPDSELPLPDGRFWTFLSVAEALHHRLDQAGVDTGGLPAFIRAARQTRIHLRDWFTTKTAPFAWESLSAYERLRRRQQPSPRLLKQLYEFETNLRSAAPTFGLVAVASAENSGGLATLVESLTKQIFRKWELLIVPQDDNARHAARKIESVDSRITVSATIDAVEAIRTQRADYLVFIEPRSELAPDALLLFADASTGENPPVLIYADEETVDANGATTPWPWPDWSPALAMSGALAGTLAAIRHDALESAGGLQAASGSALPLDGMLRVTAKVTADRVRHIASFAVRRPGRPFSPGHASATVAVVNTALHERSLEAEASIPRFEIPAGHCWVQLRWSARYLAEQPVTIVIPTRDRLDLIQRCIQRLEQTVNWSHVRLIVVNDGSREPKAVRYLAELAQRTDVPVRVLQAGDPVKSFNYSRLVNIGTAAVETPSVLHLNNDVDALEPGWLEDMAGWLAFAGTGAVGAKLVYVDGRINHAGIVISNTEALPFTPFEGLDENIPEHAQMHRLTRDASAVIGACLLTRTDLYRQINGFNEDRFGIAYNDVDFCLRLRAAGWNVLYTPQARLVHWGSESRGRYFHESEHLAFLKHYGDYRDPCLSPHLRLSGRTLAPDLERPVTPPRPRPLHLLVASHNLSLEGAPLFLYEFVEHAIRVDGFTVDLLAFADGPLRGAYEALGIRITIVDRHPIHASTNREDYITRIDAIRRTLDLSRTDLVVANTVVGFWVTELARQAGLPALWFIHESARVPRFFAHEVPPGMQTVVHDAFRQTTRVIFLCSATRRYYDEFNARDHFRILPGWVDAAAIRQFKTRHERGALRRKYGIGDDEAVILNVGTVCERKGQYYFLAAGRRLAELHRKKIRFVMVGGLNDMYHELLAGELEQNPLPGAEIITKTEAVYDYYALADLAVCSSYEESFPRVLLEAMAFEVPIVSTNVHGVPEIIEANAEGVLVPPGDVETLARAMLDTLAQGRTPNSLAPAALSKVLRRFDRTRLIPRHIAVAREAAIG